MTDSDTNAVARRKIMGFITSQVIFEVDRLGIFDPVSYTGTGGGRRRAGALPASARR